MTTPVLSQTSTLRDLFFGATPRHSRDELARELKQSGTVRALIPGLPALAAAAEREVAKATDGFLSMNLADLAASGWKRYEPLRQAARRTRTAPATEEIVALATHQITSSHHPSIDVHIDGKAIATVEVTIKVTFNMTGVLAVVRQARLVAINSGNCTVAGQLALQGVTAATKQQRFDLSGAIGLHNGIALLSADETRAPAEQGSAVMPDDHWYGPGSAAS
ncbi:hypothetical protein M2272_000783 [Mycobacterium frederiksbergense]|uniref:DUF1707 domain-containing protein n=1 Tax=Mycolicibacterium frederiksbergense TaxID=117567 RepID=A0ABT6KW03_9MYCO|nr:hypothetical protein [Mycolicibacterium frederiksbergense]MDH6194162.1 hypothetical protein [Mycolicibacterium frederiksbergense]